ncbi:MAG: phage portal protein [Planctomycetes bacterium]|nr:phage portal protein [Planctomycetota bacterium]
MNALKKAFGEVDSMRAVCKQTVASIPGDLIGAGPSPDGMNRADMSKAADQYRHNRGWVFASIRPIAQKIAGQPIRVGRVTGSPGVRSKGATKPDPLPTHPILDLLANPNDLMVAWSLMYSLVASLELTGRAFLWVTERNGKREAFPLPSSWIEGSQGQATITHWRVRPEGRGEAMSIPAAEVVYLSYPNPADPKGSISPLQAIAAAVDADEQIIASQASAFSRGLNPQFALTAGSLPGQEHKPHLTNTQRKALINTIRRLYSGIHKHGEPLILDAVITGIERLSDKPAEMDWMDSGKMTKARILQGFGVNPIIAGEVEGANRASATVAELHFCNYTLNPKIELISQCLTEWLSPMFGGSLVVWIEPCQANDAELKAKKWEAGARFGVVTENEFRSEVLGLPEIPGGDLRIGEADSFVDQVSRQVSDALSQRDVFKRNGKANLLATGR